MEVGNSLTVIWEKNLHIVDPSDTELWKDHGILLDLIIESDQKWSKKFNFQKIPTIRVLKVKFQQFDC